MKEPVYFLKLELENVACFGEKAMLDLSDGKGNWKQWTVILGDNGVGKTTLLKIMASYDIQEQNVESKLPFNVTKELAQSSEEINWIRPVGIAKMFLNIYKEENEHVEPFEFHLDFEGPELHFANFHWFGSYNYQDSRLKELRIVGYGANRIMSSTSQSPMGYIGKNFETLFNDDGKLINAEEWLLQLDYAASKDSDIKQYASDKRNQVKEMLIDLLPDVIDIRFTEPTKENLKSTVEFKTDFGWTALRNLSLGYKTMVAWMVDLAARMFDRYPDSENPLAGPAIVLVDEIDLHLHPKWQRKIFDYLSGKFPKTQFIVTAHSPLVVQSAPKDANLVLLKKEGDHVVVDNDIESVQNWRLDQILSSDLFGIESSRGPETEDWLNERKRLLQKRDLSADEKQRLKELNREAYNLPTADNTDDIEAMKIIRQAADYLKTSRQ